MWAKIIPVLITAILDKVLVPLGKYFYAKWRKTRDHKVVRIAVDKLKGSKSEKDRRNNFNDLP